MPDPLNYCYKQLDVIHLPEQEILINKHCRDFFFKFGYLRNGMQNPIPVLFLHFDVPEYPNSRWPPDAILKNLFLTVNHGMLYNMSF